MKEYFQKLLAQHGLKHWSFSAKKDAVFMQWVNEQTSYYTDEVPFAQRVYAAVSGESLVCDKGRLKGFNSITNGFRYCGRAGKCPCAAEVISAKSKASDHASRIQRSREGLMARYGVSNPGQTPTAKANHKAFYADPDKVAKATEKSRATMMEKYGVDNALKMEKINRSDIARRNLTEETKKIMDCPVLFEEFIISKSLPRAAEELGGLYCHDR
jgi:hypothetical protein